MVDEQIMIEANSDAPTDREFRKSHRPLKLHDFDKVKDLQARGLIERLEDELE